MEYLLHVLVMAGIYAILALGLNTVVGLTGLPNFGHAAFFCIGAYVSGIVSLRCMWSPHFAALIAGCASALSALVIGYPSLRVRGDYFALVTFGFGSIIYALARNWIAVTRGSLGLSGIPHWTVVGFGSRNGADFILTLSFALFTFWGLQRLANSPYGRVLTSIREDEVAALAIGKNTVRFKLQVLTLSGFIAGIAGALYAHHFTFVDPSSFTVNESIAILLMVVIGGLGNLVGSIIGAVFLSAFPEVLKLSGLPHSVAAPLHQMVFGAVLVILMIFRPQGLWGQYKWQ